MAPINDGHPEARASQASLRSLRKLGWVRAPKDERAPTSRLHQGRRPPIDLGFTRDRIMSAQVGCSRLAMALASLGRPQGDGGSESFSTAVRRGRVLINPVL